MRRIALSAGLLATLTTIAAPAAEDDPKPIVHPLADDCHGVLVLDHRRIAEGAAQAKPTSLWSAPDFAEQRAHIERQLQLVTASSGNAPPFYELLAHARGLYAAYRIPDVTGPEGDRVLERGFPMLLVMDVGEAEPAIRTWLERTVGKDLTPTQVSGIAGFTEDPESRGRNPQPFVALDGARLVVGSEALVTSWVDVGKPLPYEAPAGAPVARSHMDFSPLLDLLAIMADLDSGVDAGAQAMMGSDWRELQPRLTVSTRVDAEGGWRSTAVASGIGDWPLASVDPALARHLPERPDILLAVGVDPEAVVTRFIDALESLLAEEPEDHHLLAIAPAGDGSVRERVDRMLQQRTGMSLERIARAFTGSAALSIDWDVDAMPIPKGVAVLGVTDGDTATAVLSQVLRPFQPAGEMVDGAHMAWTVAMPMLQLTIAVGPDAVVVANRSDLAAEALAGREAATAAWSEGDCMTAVVELHAIAERWLPMGLAQLRMVEEDIGSDPLQAVRSMNWQLAQILTGDDPPERLSLALAAEGMEWYRGSLAHLFSDAEDLDTAIDRRIAVWLPADADQNQAQRQMALVLRTADHYLLIQGWNEPLEVPDAAGLRARLGSRERMMGPVLEELGFTTVPERASFDRRWLPTLPQALAHVPETYRLDLRTDADALVIEERGLPLIGGYGHSSGMMATTFTMMARHEIREMRRRKRAEELWEAEPDFNRALDRIAQVVQDLRNARGELPEKASQLVTLGHLRLAETAPLFGGEVPQHATALDLVGRWDPSPRRWPRAVLAVRVDEDWVAYVSPWGSVDLASSERLPDVPETPEDAATRPPPEGAEAEEPVAVPGDGADDF